MGMLAPGLLATAAMGYLMDKTFDRKGKRA